MFDYDLQRQQYSPWARLAILLVLTGGGLLVGSFISIPIATSYLHVPMQNIPEALLKSENVNLSRTIQFVTTFFFMALPSFIYARIVTRNPLQFIGFNGGISGKQVLIVLGIIVLAYGVSITLSEMNELIPLSKNLEQHFKNLENEYNKEMLAIANMKTFKDYIISLIIIALLPAIFEEMLFRGSLQPIMISITKNAFAGILITSVLFSAIHMSYYGFLPRLGLGLIIGYIFYFSKNLWLSSITHCLYNAIGVTEIYGLSKQGLLTDKAMAEESLPLYFGLIAAVGLIALFIFFKRESEVVRSMHNTNQF